MDLDEVDDWDLDEVDDWIWLGLIIEFWISMNGNSAAKIQKKIAVCKFCFTTKTP